MATQREKSVPLTRVSVDYKGTKHKWVDKLQQVDKQAYMVVTIGLEYKCEYYYMTI